MPSPSTPRRTQPPWPHPTLAQRGRKCQQFDTLTSVNGRALTIALCVVANGRWESRPPLMRGRLHPALAAESGVWRPGFAGQPSGRVSVGGRSPWRPPVLQQVPGCLHTRNQNVRFKQRRSHKSILLVRVWITGLKNAVSVGAKGSPAIRAARGTPSPGRPARSRSARQPCQPGGLLARHCPDMVVASGSKPRAPSLD